MPTPKKTTAVAKAETKKNEMANAAPDFMKGDSGKGTENLGQGDMEIPRLILLQSLSPQVVDGDYKAGQFFHTVLEDVIGDEDGIRIVPLFADIRFILWNPRHAGGGILARADDGKHWSPANKSFDVKPYKDQPKTVKWVTKDTVVESGLANWGSTDPDDENSQPAATKMWNFVVALPDYPELGPMVLTFQKGSASVGKNFSGKLAMSQAPSFGQIFQMSAIKDKNNNGDTFYNFSIARDEFVTDVEQYNVYKSMYEQFKSMSFGIKDLEGAQDDGPAASGGKADTPEGAIGV